MTTLLAWYWGALAVWMAFCAWDNTRLFKKPPAADLKRRKWPFVSVLIPARNEEGRIRPCLEGFLKQDYPAYEIRVLDDRSTDGTLNLVRSYAERNARRLKALRGKPLPKGWLGKPWACEQLAHGAKGEWLFFTDADTWHDPKTLQRTVRMAEEEKADLLSLLTRQETRTWMESLVVPTMAYTLLAFLPARWALSPKSPFNRFAGVSGQFMFIRKKSYRELGGHSVVRDEIVEDLNFGRRAVGKGLKVVLGNGAEFSHCRMYSNAREVWEGFSKNFFPAVGFNPFFFLNAQVVLILDGIFPFAALALGPSHILFVPALGLCLVSLAVRWVEAKEYGFHKGSVFLHPLGCFFFALIGWNSLLWFTLGGGHWKGRRLRRMAV